MVMRERRMLENAFAPLGVELKWYPFNTGADQTRAMAASSIDIASVINSTSVILANAGGNPVQIAALVSRPRQTFALMAGPGGPRNVRELKGKTVAGPKGSVLHQMLLAALAREGMKSGDVKFIHMELPAARAALLAKQADAVLQAGSLIISNEEAGLHTIISADGYITPLLFTAVRPAFAKNNPELLQIYLQVQAEAYEWISAHQAEAIAIGCRLLKIPIEDGKKLFAWSGMAKVMEESDIRALQSDVDFLYQQKMIERKINPRQFILPSAFGK
jgi:NitT/TauT family transport system substrate-binding protein/sulfonate transport system substrate-binding protein